MKMLFVGERPSARALSLGVSWKDGALCAKQLFHALRSLGLEPTKMMFDNVFEPVGSGPEIISYKAIRRIRAKAKQRKVVAMGKKVEKVLTRYCIPFIMITHPAARGKIRKRELYAKHVKERLYENLVITST